MIKNFGISFLALIFKLSNQKGRSCTQKIGSNSRDMMRHIPFFSIERYELMALWLWRVTVSQATWVRLTDHYYVKQIIIMSSYHYVTTAKDSITIHYYIFPGLADACARLAYVAKSGPLPDFKCSKTVEVGLHHVLRAIRARSLLT